MLTMRNMIGGYHILTPEWGVLSLVRKFGADHAFLVLEQINTRDEHESIQIHLVIKSETEHHPRRKAEIIQRPLNHQKLTELSNRCHSVSWPVDREKIIEFLNLVQQEEERAARNEIEYVLLGQSSVSGIFGRSLDVLQSEDLKNWSIERSASSISELLLRRGHNCYSWAQAVVLNIGLQAPTTWTECFIMNPHATLEGQHNGEESEPTTRGPSCVIS